MAEKTETRTDPARKQARMNADAWDEIAADRRRFFDQRGFDAAFFRGGGSMLTVAEVEALGDVSGMRILHLQCASGEDTLSLANIGAAEVIGIDLSANQIEQARHKAGEAGISKVTYEVADVQELPVHYRDGSFDLVLVTIGSLVWLSDLDRWAAGVAGALKPGGRLVLSDEHPVQYVFEEHEGRLVLVHSYFERDVDYHTGWGHFPSDKKGFTKANFSWTIGEVITLLGQHGVLTTSLREYAPTDPAIFVAGAPEWNRFPHIDPGDPRKLPVHLVLTAEKHTHTA